MSGPWIAAFVTLCVVALLGVAVVLGLVRRISALLQSLEDFLASGMSGMMMEGLPPGSALPSFEAMDSHGLTVTDTDVRGASAVFVFLDPGCAPCKTLAKELHETGWSESRVRVFAVVDRSTSARELDVGSTATTLYQDNGSVARAFRSSITPNALALDARGTVVGRLIPNSLADLAQLASRARGGGDIELEPAQTVVSRG